MFDWVLNIPLHRMYNYLKQCQLTDKKGESTKKKPLWHTLFKGSKANRKKFMTHKRNELHFPSKIVGTPEKSCSRRFCGWISYRQLWSFTRRILYGCRYFSVSNVLIEITNYYISQKIYLFGKNYQICTESPLRIWKHQHLLLYFASVHSSYNFHFSSLTISSLLLSSFIHWHFVFSVRCISRLLIN